MEETKAGLYVTLFSKFEVKDNMNILNEEALRSDKLLKLFVYVLTNRKGQLRTSDLYDILWKQNDQDVTTGSGALKNLFYRLRTVLHTTFQRKDFIISIRGAYAWNKEINVVIDCEQFINGMEQAKQTEDIPQKIERYEAALQLYTGDYLPQHTDEFWILQRSTYYHTIFVQSVKKLAQLYIQQNEYEKLEQVCHKALQIEKLDDNLHCLYITSLLLQHKKTNALEHYKMTRTLLYAELGVSPSSELQALYKEILEDLKSEEEELQVVQQEFKEQHEQGGAFYCESGVFKEIYAIQARQAKRLGIAVYCAMITIKVMKHIPVDSDMYRRLQDTTMECLKEVVIRTLRSGDVVTRYSTTQFMMLLPTCDYEGGIIAMNRIEELFYQTMDSHAVKLVCDLNEMVVI